jgi:hypothetical protein
MINMYLCWVWNLVYLLSNLHYITLTLTANLQNNISNLNPTIIHIDNISNLNTPILHTGTSFTLTTVPHIDNIPDFTDYTIHIILTLFTLQNYSLHMGNISNLNTKLTCTSLTHTPVASKLKHYTLITFHITISIHDSIHMTYFITLFKATRTIYYW